MYARSFRLCSIECSGKSSGSSSSPIRGVCLITVISLGRSTLLIGSFSMPQTSHRNDSRRCFASSIPARRTSLAKSRRTSSPTAAAPNDSASWFNRHLSECVTARSSSRDRRHRRLIAALGKKRARYGVFLLSFLFSFERGLGRDDS